jgi:hypothetical protein
MRKIYTVVFALMVLIAVIISVMATPADSADLIDCCWGW